MTRKCTPQICFSLNVSLQSLTYTLFPLLYLLCLLLSTPEEGEKRGSESYNVPLDPPSRTGFGISPEEFRGTEKGPHDPKCADFSILIKVRTFLFHPQPEPIILSTSQGRDEGQLETLRCRDIDWRFFYT